MARRQRIGVALVLLAMTRMPGIAASNWHVIDNGEFSFSLPTNFTKTDARGIDSFVEEFKTDAITLSFDYGAWSNNFSDWPLLTRYEITKIDGRKARIGTAKKSFDKIHDYSTQVHFSDMVSNEQGVKLSMFASCASPKDVEVAHQIFRSIKFKRR